MVSTAGLVVRKPTYEQADLMEEAEDQEMRLETMIESWIKVDTPVPFRAVRRRKIQKKNLCV